RATRRSHDRPAWLLLRRQWKHRPRRRPEIELREPRLRWARLELRAIEHRLRARIVVVENLVQIALHDDALRRIDRPLRRRLIVDHGAGRRAMDICRCSRRVQRADLLRRLARWNRRRRTRRLLPRRCVTRFDDERVVERFAFRGSRRRWWSCAAFWALCLAA